MKRTLTINGRKHTLEWNSGDVLRCRFDGTTLDAQAVEIRAGLYSILIGGKQFRAHVVGTADPSDGSTGSAYSVQVNNATHTITVHDPRRWSQARGELAREGRQQIMAPMPGKIVRVLVSEGQQVAAGQGVIVVEAMKMQNEIRSSSAGIVTKLSAAAGQAVNAGEILMTIE